MEPLGTILATGKNQGGGGPQEWAEWLGRAVTVRVVCRSGSSSGAVMVGVDPGGWPISVAPEGSGLKFD